MRVCGARDVISREPETNSWHPDLYQASRTRVPPSTKLGPNPRSIRTINMAFAWKASGLTYFAPLPTVGFIDIVNRYNRYLAVAARVVRRSLKEQPRLQAEKRGEMELRFAKWQVSAPSSPIWKFCVLEFVG
jgi:hypothetical protein